MLGDFRLLHLFQSGTRCCGGLLDVGGAKRGGHRNVEGMLAASPDGDVDVAWASVVDRNQRPNLSFREKAGMFCLIKDSVTKSIMAADSFILRRADDGVIAEGIHWRIKVSDTRYRGTFFG